MALVIANKRNYSGPGVYIGRPSMLGNPFSVQQYGRAQCIEKYRAWLKAAYAKHGKVYAEIQRLVEIAEQGDLVLVCWCSPEPCHGDIVKRVVEHLVSVRGAQKLEEELVSEEYREADRLATAHDGG